MRQINTHKYRNSKQIEFLVEKAIWVLHSMNEELFVIEFETLAGLFSVGFEITAYSRAYPIKILIDMVYVFEEGYRYIRATCQRCKMHVSSFSQLEDMRECLQETCYAVRV